MTQWATIETLTPDAMTVSSVGGASRGFAGVYRTLQRMLTKTPALYDELTTARIIRLIGAVRDHAETVDLPIPTRSGLHRLLAQPAFGPAGDVHGIQLWLGPALAEVPSPAAAAGAIWDLDSQTIQLPSGITQLPGIVAEEYAPRISVAELFHRMPTFDRHTEVLDLLYGPKPGERLQFGVTIAAGAGRSGQWRITIRARDDQRTRGAWLLIEDTTSDDAPTVWPTLERTGLREAHRRAGTHLAVFQLAHASISHWLTDPAPWIRWDYLFRPVDVFHPDDRARLVDLSGQLRGGASATVTVRTLNYDGGYSPTAMHVYPYPGFANQELAIAELSGSSHGMPMMEPGGGTAGYGRSPSPVGYDDQLRHRLSAEWSPSPTG